MKKLDIIYEDKDILVVNKEAGLLTISDGKSDNTLYSEVREYVKKKHKSNKIFIVHRLDKDTSGIVLFAKNEEIKRYLQDNWTSYKREYIAILNGVLKTKIGVIKNYLKENRSHFVYVSKDKRGEYAETLYKVIKTTNNKTIVKINIITGKKHQIRVGFANLGYPIMGDKKYGLNNYPKLCLHASKLEIKINNKTYVFSSKIPSYINKFIK